MFALVAICFAQEQNHGKCTFHILKWNIFRKNDLNLNYIEKSYGKSLAAEVQIEEIVIQKHIGGEEHVPFSLKPFKHHNGKQF